MVLTASMALAVLLGCGVALAATVNCEGGTCVGTRSNDTLFGIPRVDEKFGLGKGDLMYGYESADRMSGGAGGDLIQAVDDQKDQIHCAGGRDEVYFDRDLDELRRCEALHRR
ncbi:MAG TPA: hypothetical protein VFY59_06930 [Rubrobacter sp.]|nr:hypothetical protein [Rubrobacter sp.]